MSEKHNHFSQAEDSDYPAFGPETGQDTTGEAAVPATEADAQDTVRHIQVRDESGEPVIIAVSVQPGVFLG